LNVTVSNLLDIKINTPKRKQLRQHQFLDTNFTANEISVDIEFALFGTMIALAMLIYYHFRLFMAREVSAV